MNKLVKPEVVHQSMADDARKIINEHYDSVESKPWDGKTFFDAGGVSPPLLYTDDNGFICLAEVTIDPRGIF